MQVGYIVTPLHEVLLEAVRVLLSGLQMAPPSMWRPLLVQVRSARLRS
jgi:hypothetical protein